MPKGPNGEKWPADVIGNAVKIARIATGEEEDDRPATRLPAHRRHQCATNPPSTGNATPSTKPAPVTSVTWPVRLTPPARFARRSPVHARPRSSRPPSP